ncbi:uncharacterized protein BX663DRAFT_498788 [Cokeromyces recurvatus]|uniref:uncharacterized protein n=1 Tax=Cokeromyces recurvatus TaxID=90255 RepID=UPI00221EC3E1|nr:uncharacterized protein BX663DRAFT_498788 [Cokeromyces recurvatus]KAI7906102.1 hypothetical protein BX663DRAFT_498788 [Cokeromyces recurvatus]
MHYNPKYHVTIEDYPEEEDEKLYQRQQQQHAYSATSITDDNLKNYQTDDMGIDSLARGSKRQAWEEVDALEEQARSEKIQDQNTAKANATEAARIIKEAQR